MKNHQLICFHECKAVNPLTFAMLFDEVSTLIVQQIVVFIRYLKLNVLVNPEAKLKYLLALPKLSNRKLR